MPLSKVPPPSAFTMAPFAFLVYAVTACYILPSKYSELTSAPKKHAAFVFLGLNDLTLYISLSIPLQYKAFLSLTANP